MSRTPGRARRANSQPEAVEVYCRIRPADLTPDFEDCLAIRDDRTLALGRPGSGRSTEYTFTRVFDDYAKQEELFGDVGLPLVEELLAGRNGLLFTYGVTGSGKTFTMQGTQDNAGLLPRCLDTVFNSVAGQLTKRYVVRPDRANGFDVFSEASAMMERQRIELNQRQQPAGRGQAEPAARTHDPSRVAGANEDNLFSVFVSYVEIYNKLVYDLLEDFSAQLQVGRVPTSRTLREDSRRNMFVSGATEVECLSSDEAYAVFLRGQARRKVAQTALNAESSRSHSIFTVRLVQGPYDSRIDEMVQDKTYLTVSQLCLVDLAGSERTVRTGNAGSRLREASNINNSLLVLKRCMETLRENQRAPGNAPTKMVPYRDSKITHLFKNYFDGDGMVKMVLCVNRNAEEAEETANVLKFAEVTQEVQVQRAKAPSTPRWEPRPTTPTLQPTAPLADPLDEERLWQFNSLPELPAPPVPDADAADDLAACQQLARLAAERLRLADAQWQQFDQRLQLFRAALEADDAEATPSNSDAFERVEELERILANNRAEKQRLEKRLRNMELKISKEKFATDNGRKELMAKLEEQENLLRRERADKVRLVDQYRYRLDSAQKSSAKPAPVANGGVVSNRAALRRSRSQEQVSEQPSGPAPGLVSRLRTRFSPSQAANQEAAGGQRRAGAAPAANPRYQHQHRRSRSAGQLLVEHHAENETPSGTVMQPRPSGRRKSVTRLEAKDIRKATEYVLTHQTAGSNGGLRTELIKASVTPTAGGGSAVTFNDVERLEQHSPSALASDNSWLTRSGSRKRKADEPPPALRLDDFRDGDADGDTARRRCQQLASPDASLTD